jgi:Ca2+-binding EF-hand superfamily protein
MLSIYDRNHSGQISPDDFITIFQTYNLDFSSSDIQNIFQQFDTNQIGAINYDLLMDNLIGQMNERRRLSVQKVFDSFNKNEQGEVLLSEIKQKYNSGGHPDVVSGRKRREEEFSEFLDKIEIFREYNDNLKMSYSTTMNFNEFLRFYSEISMSIKDDNLFDNILYNCWNINYCLEDRNINYNNINDRNNDINIRARTGKQIMNRNNMPY